jgi:hypothetical protein
MTAQDTVRLEGAPPHPADVTDDTPRPSQLGRFSDRTWGASGDRGQRAEVNAQLAALIAGQYQMAQLASLQLEDRKRQQPSLLAWGQAILLLVFEGSFMFIGIVFGLAGTTEAAAASSLQAQANSAITQVNKAAQPVISLVSSKGAAWVAAHATKAEVSDLTSADQWAKVYRTDSDEASADQSSADRSQLEGPALLSFGSATLRSGARVDTDTMAGVPPMAQEGRD